MGKYVPLIDMNKQRLNVEKLSKQARRIERSIHQRATSKASKLGKDPDGNETDGGRNPPKSPMYNSRALYNTRQSARAQSNQKLAQYTEDEVYRATAQSAKSKSHLDVHRINETEDDETEENDGTLTAAVEKAKPKFAFVP